MLTRYPTGPSAGRPVLSHGGTVRIVVQDDRPDLVEQTALQFPCLPRLRRLGAPVKEPV